jgi:hypothetical protein
MDTTTVYIEPADSVGTVIVGGPEPFGTVIIGDETLAVVLGEPDVVASEKPDPVSVIVADNPITVLISQPELTIIGPDIPGPPGTVGAADAAAVTYDSALYANVQEALDAILYVAPKVNSFTNSANTVEQGSTVASVTLNWSFNKAMTSVKLNGGDVDPAASSTVIAGPFTSNQSWTLTASDGTNTTSATTSITFAQKRYWGASPLESLDDPDIIALGGSEFASNFDKTVSYDCTGGKYPYIAYPASFGRPSAVTVGGLAFSDFIVATQDFTNASGFESSYFVIRFKNLQTGAKIAVVWA